MKNIDKKLLKQMVQLGYVLELNRMVLSAFAKAMIKEDKRIKKKRMGK